MPSLDYQSVTRHSKTWVASTEYLAGDLMQRLLFWCSVYFMGLGLATKLQEFTVTTNGLVANILSFNVGVEIGQILALTAVLIGITFWRTRPSFTRHAFMTNSVLMIGGFILTAQQLFGYVFYP